MPGIGAAVSSTSPRRTGRRTRRYRGVRRCDSKKALAMILSRILRKPPGYRPAQHRQALSGRGKIPRLLCRSARGAQCGGAPRVSPCLGEDLIASDRHAGKSVNGFCGGGRGAYQRSRLVRVVGRGCRAYERSWASLVLLAGARCGEQRVLGLHAHRGGRTSSTGIVANSSPANRSREAFGLRSCPTRLPTAASSAGR